MQLALGDALALGVMEMRGVAGETLAALHPGGAIGLAVTPVGDLMHRGRCLWSRRGWRWGCDPGDDRGAFRAGRGGRRGWRLLGVITDGDLRRHVAVLGQACAGQVMSARARSLRADMAGEDALMLMNDAKITAAFVVEEGRVLGILHIHDLLQAGLN
jgi:arabinose-5-phosphate isomerase